MRDANLPCSCQRRVVLALAFCLQRSHFLSRQLCVAHLAFAVQLHDTTRQLFHPAVLQPVHAVRVLHRPVESYAKLLALVHAPPQVATVGWVVDEAQAEALFAGLVPDESRARVGHLVVGVVLVEALVHRPVVGPIPGVFGRPPETKGNSVGSET